MTVKKTQHKELSEKRSSNRQDLQLLISYIFNDKTYSKFSYNLSPGGMFIESITPLQVGTKIILLFELPHNKLNFSIDAEVTWINQGVSSEPFGMGVKFVTSDLTALKHIETATEYYKKFLKKAS